VGRDDVARPMRARVAVRVFIPTDLVVRKRYDDRVEPAVAVDVVGEHGIAAAVLRFGIERFGRADFVRRK